MEIIEKHITKELLEKSLQEYLDNQKLKVLRFNCSLAVAPTESYNSNLIRACITYSASKNANEETTTVIVKTSPEPTNHPFDIIHDMLFFQKEIQMYTKILPEVHLILGDLGVIAPKCIKIEENPIRLIITEDLSVKGFKMADRREGLDLEHCKLVVKKIAQLHAASLLIYKKNPQKFSIFHQGLLPGNSAIKQWIKLAIADIIEAASQKPKMKNYIYKLKQIQHKVIEKCAEAACPSSTFNVLNHGDCWTSNIMFQYDSNACLQDLRLLDYQIGVYSSPAIDLHYFWATSANLDVCRHSLDAILDYYYENLLSTLVSVKYNIDDVPTKEEFRKDWFARAYYGFVTAITVFGITKCSVRSDASVMTLFDPDQNGKDSFRYHVYNNQSFWDHFEYFLQFFDNLGIFDV